MNGENDPELPIAAGQVERWRVVNASSSRYVLLSIGSRPFTILGTDGGLIPEPVTAAQVLLAPADRVELAVGPFGEGETLALESLPYDRGMPKDNGGRYATVRVGSPAPSHAQIPKTLRTIEPLVTGNITPNRTVHLQFRASLRRGFDWTVDGETHHQADPVRVGELQVWDVVNETKMDHPFHLHGFFFQVIEVNGAPPEFLSWEDTVNIPAQGRVRIAWLPDDRPRELDVPLPHPRASRRRDDGALRCHPMSAEGELDMSTDQRLNRAATVTEGASLRLAATLLLTGQVIFILITQFHTGGDANDHPSIFAKYADSGDWKGVHALQFGAIALIVAGLVALYFALESQTGRPAWAARIGAALAVVSLALYGALQAVDGVGNKQVDCAWVHASAAGRPARFASAESMRWLEWGMSSYHAYALGLSLVLIAAAAAAVDATVVPRAIPLLMGLSGIAYLAQGWVAGSQGFTATHSTLIVVSWAFSLAWMIWLVVITRRTRQRRTAAAN